MKARFQALAEKVRRGEPLPPVCAAVLEAATPAVRVGMWLRRLRPRVFVDARVISFGNLTAGGTGKTPAVIERARAESAAGKKVAVLTRGYGSDHARRPVVVDSDTPNAYALVGDEAALIARKVAGARIVKCADRVAGARTAMAEFGCDTLLLDDGYQYVRLARNENVLLVDATNPFGNGHLIPRGILREPPAAARRATRIILTRCDQADDLPNLMATLLMAAPQAPVRKTRHAPTALWRVADGETVALDTIRGRQVKAVCAIASPEAFYKTLEDIGAAVAERVAFTDHAEIAPEALAFEGPVVVTEKDAVRMDRTRTADNVLALAVELRDCE